MSISNQPPKGTADWFPEEFAVRKYIFDTWRKVCLRYGYEEYLTPLVESAEVYRAKSGEDIGGKELVTFTDLGGRELSIRPEMTPSVTRMITQVYDSAPKPIRYFSIANFMRNEKPQRGRNREFWQLNVDLFGATGALADVEILSLAMDIMLEFNPPKDSFKLCLNHRELINGALTAANVLPEKKDEVVRLLDKYEKIDFAVFKEGLAKFDVVEDGVEKLAKFLEAVSLDELLVALPELADNKGLIELKVVSKYLTELGYRDWLSFKPSVIRGFDYYDGIVFEIFDNHPDNKRALFGGGRYNGLAGIFGGKTFPAIGFAPGDETLRLFLESWDMDKEIKDKLRSKIYYFPLLANELEKKVLSLTSELRQDGKEVIMGLDTTKINKALEYANKKKVAYTIIYGEDEAEKNIYKIKDMESGQEEIVKL
ncbi:MAG: histidine--tRNA ligase [Patescibacteria group bacterium]|nr:histidine--tRNA ligase [Patescibacteria group bacterium]